MRSGLTSVLIGAIVIACSPVHAALTGAEVSGGSEDSGSFLAIDPPLLDLLTTSIDPTFIELTPDGSGVQSFQMSVVQFNATSEPWLGIEYALDNGGTFTAVPELTFGGVFESAVSLDTTRATLETSVMQSNGLFAEIFIQIQGVTTLTINPLVPEPALAMAPIALALGLRRCRG